MPSLDDLEVFHRSHQVTLATYRLTGTFPNEERYALTSQLRRAASSVPINLAEGAGRYSKKDYRRFVSFAAGSAAELEYALGLATELGFADPATTAPLIDEVIQIRKMLRGLANHLSRN